MKRLTLPAILAVALLFAACSDADPAALAAATTTTEPPTTTTTEPPTTTTTEDLPVTMSQWFHEPEGGEVVISWTEFLGRELEAATSVPSERECDRLLDLTIERFGPTGSIGSVADALDRAPDATFARHGRNAFGQMMLGFSACAEGDFVTASSLIESAAESMQAMLDTVNG